MARLGLEYIRFLIFLQYLLIQLFQKFVNLFPPANTGWHVGLREFYVGWTFPVFLGLDTAMTLYFGRLNLGPWPNHFPTYQPYSSPMVIILCACSSPGKHIKNPNYQSFDFKIQTYNHIYWGRMALYINIH